MAREPPGRAIALFDVPTPSVSENGEELDAFFGVQSNCFVRPPHNEVSAVIHITHSARVVTQLTVLPDLA